MSIGTDRRKGSWHGLHCKAPARSLTSTGGGTAGSVSGTPRMQAERGISGWTNAPAFAKHSANRIHLSRKTLSSISAFLGITKMLYLLVLAQFWTENRFALF